MRSAIAAVVTGVLAANACGARPAPPLVVHAVIEREAPEAGPPETAPSPSWTLVAGGVTACAESLPGGPACWGSWGDSVPEGVDFDPHAPRALPADVREVAPGWTHTCVRTTTSVRCEGRYELGDPVAAEPAELAGTRQLASGRDFTCGLRPDGTLACVSARPHPGLAAPVAPTGLRALAATSSGWQLCALGEGAAFCWPSLDRAPIAIALPAVVGELVMASEHACARAPEGTLWCWSIAGGAPTRIEGVHAEALAALNDRMCARDGAHWICLTPDALVPEPIAWLEGARAIAGGMGFVCGAFESGVRCFGDDDFGQLGALGTAPAPPASVPPRVEATGARGLGLERAQMCIVTTEGRVACGSDGPRRVVRGLSHVVELRSGDEHTCARTERGDVHCWGRMLVDHGEDVDPVWRTFSAGRRLATGAIAIASGPDDACVLRAAPSSLRCWGSPFAIPGQEWLALPEPARALATGAVGTCALGASGEAFCAESSAGALARDEAWRGAEAMAATDTVRCAVALGEVRCAGRNERGQLGDGTRTARALPVRVRDVADATRVAIGEAHACALLASGRVRCWGANEAGQLGDGSRTDRWRAVSVHGVAHAVEIALAASTSCARLEDGTVVCWGAALGESLERDEPAATPFPRPAS